MVNKILFQTRQDSEIEKLNNKLYSQIIHFDQYHYPHHHHPHHHHHHHHHHFFRRHHRIDAVVIAAVIVKLRSYRVIYV